MSTEEVVKEIVEETLKNTSASFIEVFVIIAFVVLQSALVEAVGWHYIYQKPEYKDLKDKIYNLGKRVKVLKHDYLYGTSTKKKQE